MIDVNFRVFFESNWLEVQKVEMDKGIRVADGVALCVAGYEVKKGDLIVVGNTGIKTEMSPTQTQAFGFMTSEVSTERIKTLLIEKIADETRLIKKRNGRILLVAGPAVVHMGSSKYVSQLISNGFINLLFAGNALAVHDLKQAYLGTSLGVSLRDGRTVEGGNHNHLHTINLIRYYGSIKKAIEKGVIKSGIMYEAIGNKIPFVLADSIRDDGPLPEVITDSQKAQKIMREEIRKGVDIAIMVASTLHSIATGNLLPAWVNKVVVDTNPLSVIKFSDRGTTGSVGIVTDCEFFFSQLSRYLL